LRGVCRATLGECPIDSKKPQRGLRQAAMLQRVVERRNPRRGWDVFGILPRVGRAAPTLGFGTESRWDSL
jgi:hypothetical protein